MLSQVAGDYVIDKIMKAATKPLRLFTGVE